MYIIVIDTFMDFEYHNTSNPKDFGYKHIPESIENIVELLN